MGGSSSEENIDRAWWKESVVYQVYPRSFNDSDGDGVGDIPGIVERLDYLDELGVDIVWLNPVYQSPNADNGYDISDYRAIMDEFGTMDDWEALLEGLHDRDIRLIMDLVVNHTSDEHEWFVKSRAGEEDYRDYYFWRDGRTDVEGFTGWNGPEDEAPPNEWESFFGGPAWAYDEEVDKWYLHLFDEKQPDLNWENPEVRDEVFDMMEWWFEKGIDGFRMDVINLISKPPDVTDHDPPTNQADYGDTFDGPRIHEFLQEMNDRVLSNYDAFTLGEMVGTELPHDLALQYIGPDGDGLSSLYHFEHVLLDQGEAIWHREDYELTQFKEVFSRWQKGMYPDGWESLYLGNHDQPRIVSRFGSEEYRQRSAKLLGTLLHTLRGTPYIYQGDELGMTNYPFESLDEFRDVATINPVQNALDSGEIASFENVRENVAANSRDNARTPMQWTDAEHAGFTTGEPWISVNPNYARVNAEHEREDPDSVFNYYKALIEVRHDNDVLIYGEYDQLYPDHDELWAYTRTLGDERALVMLNFAEEETDFVCPEELRPADGAEVLIANYDEVSDDPTGVTLRPWEARVYRL